MIRINDLFVRKDGQMIFFADPSGVESPFLEQYQA